jgi:ATP-binding cassette subfamily B protein
MMETDMRSDLFAHLETLSYSYFSETKVGQIMSRITSDLFDITEFAHHCPEEIIITGLKIIIAFIYLMTIDIPLTLILFAILPIMLFASLSFRKKMRDSFKDRRTQTGELNAQVEDSLLGIRVVKSFANEELEKEKFNRGNKIFFKVKKISYHYMAGFQATTKFFEGVMYISVIIAGSIFLKNGRIGVDDFAAYILYIATLTTSIRTILNFTEQFQNGITGLERFIEIMDTKADITDSNNAIELNNVKGEILFDNVSFKYPGTEQEVLSKINLHISPGESVALVGASGTGKTTICNLIPRFYDVDQGSIYIDGTDIRKFKLHSLRRNIGMVQQDVYMFSGTVKENIEYGRPGADFSDIEAAAKRAGAHDFISALPNGYDTYIGERGVKLSGGQKQRLSIARVFLKDPPILILDEATSSLDNESEKLIQKSLEELSKGRTVLTIAHRLTTIKNADKILVITENGIEEEGSHSQLIKKHGIYYQLYTI